MAIVEMERMRLVGLKRDKTKIMNVLTRSGVFEVSPTEKIEGLEKIHSESHIAKLKGKLARLSFGIDYLYKTNFECFVAFGDKKFKINPGGSRKIIGYDDFYDSSAKEYELLAKIDELEKISFKRLELKSRVSKLENLNKTLLPYSGCDIKFCDFIDSAYASMALFYNPSAAADAHRVLDEYNLEYEEYSAKGRLFGIIMPRALKGEITAKFNETGFAQCTFDYDDTAGGMIEKNLTEIELLKNAGRDEMRNAVAYTGYMDEFKILYDFIGTELEKSVAEKDFLSTDSTFVAQGWIPLPTAQHVIDEIRSKANSVVTYLEKPGEGDEPPTLTKNPKLVAPFEDITNMYMVPKYRETDPNPFMAIFFFLFFGVMVADAGYGLILSVGMLLAIRLRKMEKGMARLMSVIGMCGISAIVWGILFGSYFSIEGIAPLWFNPLEDPLMMLGLCIVLGVLQLMVGYGLRAAALIKDKKVFSAIFDVGFIYLLFAGIAMLALPMLIPSMGKTVSTVGMWMLIAALAGIFLTAGRSKKGIFGKLIGGFSGLYNLVNLLSDVLSYTRMFGLGLASGAIGVAFNSLAGMLFAIPAVGYVIGAVLLVPLHLFNMGIGILGAYVHNSRLQYLEFYGKFYEGNGRIFTPLGENTKYIRFN